MHPRQLRVGDLVDDYCPRERRLSNHAVVALVGDDIRQVRCTTCDGEHEYRGGKVPVSRRKKPRPTAGAGLARDVVALPIWTKNRLPPNSRPTPRRPRPREAGKQGRSRTTPPTRRRRPMPKRRLHRRPIRRLPRIE
jgi:hypothetical protein